MLTTYQQETLENIKRTAVRGRRVAQAMAETDGYYLDIFQHIIDEVQRMQTREANEAT